MFSACSFFELDNKEAPEETLCGAFTDADGNAVLTTPTSAGIVIRTEEMDYIAPGQTEVQTADYNSDFYAKTDGTYNNCRYFPGKYKVYAYGPFMPLYLKDGDGNVAIDNTKTVDIKGVTRVDYTVEPFLKVEWAGLPVVSANKISVPIKVTRAVTPERFQEVLEPTGTYSADQINVTDVRLYVSYAPQVGQGNSDSRWSSYIEYTGATFEKNLGNAITLTSEGTIPSGRKVFIRAAARINYSTLDNRRYNYTDIIEVDIP